jgi:hypothetical protein
MTRLLPRALAATLLFFCGATVLVNFGYERKLGERFDATLELKAVVNLGISTTA